MINKEGYFEMKIPVSTWRRDEKEAANLSVDGTVEAGGIIDPLQLAGEVGISVKVIFKLLNNHPQVEKHIAKGGRALFCSQLKAPEPTAEGLKALDEEKRKYLDKLGRDARADFISLIDERRKAIGQKNRIKRGMVIKKF